MNSTTTTNKNNKSFLEVPIRLSVDDKTRHWVYFRAIPRTEAERQQSAHKTPVGGGTVEVPVRVHNGRPHMKELTLDQTSFELFQDCPTSLSTADFYKLQHEGDEALKEQYYKEVSDFVQKRLGCDKVHCFHHQVRAQKKTTDDDDAASSSVQGYAGGGPHTDSSPVSADQLALTTAAEHDEQYERYVYLNLWRSIDDEHPIQNDHLAMLDERTTVKPDDYITKDLFGDGYDVVQYGLNARHANQHKWYYFPHMTKNEAILFKQMDSDWTKSGRICFHMSVNDKEVAAATTAPPRQSIEVRMMCFWKKASVNSMPTKENTHPELIQDPSALAEGDGSSSLSNSTMTQLVMELFHRTVGPFLGFSRPLLTYKSTYSGKPQDYVDRFINVVKVYSSWPKYAQNWATGELRKRKTLDEGIVFLTGVLVDDSMGYQQTKRFSKEEKKEIVDALLHNEQYMAAAKERWAPLVV